MFRHRDVQTVTALQLVETVLGTRDVGHRPVLLVLLLDRYTRVELVVSQPIVLLLGTGPLVSVGKHTHLPVLGLQHSQTLYQLLFDVPHPLFL
jgi:hypothetical protein